MNTPTPDVSIIIVNYNTSELLRQLLLSIKKNITGISYEVIIVDNSSSDGSQEMVKQTFPEVNLICNRQNAGTSAANNLGAANAAGKCILLCNSDIIINPNAIESLFAFLEETPEAAAVGCKLLNADSSLQRSCGVFPSLRTEFYLRSFLSRLLPNHPEFGRYKLAGWDYASIRPVEWITSACLLIRKNVYDSLGGFDEEIFMFYDEVEFAFRLQQAGQKMFFLPDVAVFHLHGGAWQNYREIPIRNSSKNALYFFRKHYPGWQTQVLKAFLLLEVLLSMFVFLPLLILKGEGIDDIRSRSRGYWASLKLILGIA